MGFDRQPRCGSSVGEPMWDRNYPERLHGEVEDGRQLPQLVLHDGTPYGFPKLAEELRRLADMADKGEIVSFAYGAEKRSGGCMFAAWHDIGSTAHGLVGAVEAVKQRIIRRYLVTRDNE